MTGAAPRIVVIGAGSIGRRHAENLGTLGAHAELIPWREFSRGGLDRAPEADGLVIATATHIRRELVEFCASHELPFYVEKPLAWSVEEAEALHDVAGPVAERSLIGFMMRYHPALRDLAAEDKGDVYGFSMEIGHDVRQWRANWRFADSYASAPEGGGVLLDLCHELDMAIALFPDLRMKQCDALGHKDFPGVDMASFVQVAADGGPVGRIEMDYLSPVSIRRTVLRGLDRHFDVDFLAPSVAKVTADKTNVSTYQFVRNDMFLDAMRDFIALVEGRPTSGNPLMPRFDQMQPSSRLIAESWEAREFNGAVDFDLG